MYSLEIIKRFNAEEQPSPPDRELCYHPRILALAGEVDRLPVDGEYRRWLRHSVWRYADQIIARPEPPQGGGWDDLEALQQVAMADAMEAGLHTR